MSDQLTNPLALINRFASDGNEATEILICTFNQNLSFFERSVLGASRATGARVTVLGDVDVAQHDAAAIGRAGTGYVVANVRGPKTFHPKLISIVGTDHAVVAVGSGNLTVAGWWGNDEVWTFHHGVDRAGSPVLQGVARWCRELHRHVDVPHLGRDALERTADLLDNFQPVDASVGFVHSLTTPIIDQLPNGPVEELHLYAPFIDHRGIAISELIQRLQPGVTRLGFQPGLTSADGPTLRSALGERVEVLELPVDRYRHGKLIEWCIDGQWTTFTGSANLSASALCTSVSKGGNVEIGVIAPTVTPLMPRGASAHQDRLSSLTPTARTSLRREVPLLLAATRRPDGVHIECVRILPAGSEVHIATPDDLPGSWPRSVTAPEDQATFILPDEVGGTRLRIRLPDERRSNIVFVVDPEQALRRPRHSSVIRRRIVVIDEIFRDPAAAREMFALLDELGTAHRGKDSSPDATRAPKDDDDRPIGLDWRSYLEDATDLLGPDTLRFLLGVDTSGTGTPRGSDRNWDDDGPEDAPGGIDGESPDDAADEAESSGTSFSEYQASDAQRRRYWRAITVAETKDPVSELLAIRLVLGFVAAGGFRRSDHRWRHELLTRIERLGAMDTPDELAPRVASLVALVLAITKSTLPSLVLGVETLEQRRVERAVRQVLVDVDRATIEQLAEPIATRFGGIVSTDDVIELSRRIVEGDPFEDAVAAVTARGTDIEVVDHRVRLIEPTQNPTNSALSVLSHFEMTDEVVVRAERDSHNWAVAVWRRPHLLILQPGKPTAGWGVVYDLSGVALSALAPGEIQVVSDREVEYFTVKQPPGQLATAILERAGVTRTGQLR